MNVTIKQLKVFVTVVDESSYTRASERLFISQPAVSMQLAQMEKQIGLPLLERLSRKVTPTDAGLVLYQTAKEVLQSLHNTAETLEQMQGLKAGKLTLAVAATANYFCSNLLAKFRQCIPDLAVSLHVTNRNGLLQHLADNTVDLVIMGLPPEGLNLVSTPFLDNPLVVIAPPDYPLKAQTCMSLRSLAKESFVVREMESGTRQAMERFFIERGVSLNTAMEMRSNEAVQLAVQAGLGLGIVSRHTLDAELETQRLKLLNVEGFPIMRRWHLVHRQGKRLSPVARAFYEFVCDSGDKEATAHSQ